jgi:hypothetical protein
MAKVNAPAARIGGSSGRMSSRVNVNSEPSTAFEILRTQNRSIGMFSRFYSDEQRCLGTKGQLLAVCDPVRDQREAGLPPMDRSRVRACPRGVGQTTSHSALFRRGALRALQRQADIPMDAPENVERTMTKNGPDVKLWSNSGFERE